MSMKMLSLSEYFRQNRSRRVDAFFSVCFLICNYIEEQHKKGHITRKFNPDVIYIDFENNKISIIDKTSGINDFLPYISPEQTGRLNRQVDIRSQLYSLGAIFYTLLVGKPPFYARDLLGWCYAHISVQPEPPESLNAEVPPVLSDIIMKLLAKSPDDRYQSVVGLRADLQKCYRQWQEKRLNESFTLGKADIRKHLRFHNGLMGREKEIELLKNALNNVCQGNIETVFISGYPGVGKTSLVNELENHVVSISGQFVRGCYEQFQRDIPYLGIIRIIRDLIRQILSKRQDEIANWKDRINKVLGINGGVIAEVIPEIRMITGEFPPVQALPPKETDNRFLLVFKSFLQLFIQGTKYPLVIFLDDLQWIDPASLKLIKAFTDDGIDGSLLFIGAYRTNEVDEKHPVYEIIRSFEDARIPVRHITLDTLSLDTTRELVFDILQCENDSIDLLAKNIFQKSAGNPLYIKRIIQNLYEDGNLYFSSKELRWKCIDYELLNIEVKESVVDYVINRIKKLPADTIDLLKFASCAGKSFYTNDLLNALNQSADWIKQSIKPAVDAGIIIKKHQIDITENYPEYSNNQYTKGDLSVCYEFLHDRVREAAYSLLSDEERKEAHYKAGKAILEKTDLMSRTEEFFAAVDHLNLSIDMIKSEEERIKLSEINLMAAKKAKQSSALSASMKYLKAGMELLPEGSWKRFYNLAFQIYLEYYWCVFSLKGFPAAEPVFRLLMERAKNTLDRTEIYYRKTVLCTGYYKPEEAILAGLEALKHLGLSIPVKPGKNYLLKEIMSIKLKLAAKNVESLLDLPKMTNQRAKKIISLLANLTPPASLINPQLFSYILLKMTSISLEYGNTDYSAFAYACYGIVCVSIFGEYETAARLKEVALKLAQDSSDYIAKTKVYYTIAVYLNHWNDHLTKNLDYGEKAYYYASQVGDWMMEGVIQTEMVQIKCMLGESIEEIYRQYETALSNIKYGMPDSLNLLHTINQFIKCLKGETNNTYTFSDENYDENTVAEKMLATGKGFIVHHYYLMKIQTYYLHGRPMEAFDIVLKQQDKFDSVLGKMLYAENIFWACIVSLAVYNTLDNEKKKKARKIINKNMRLLKKWGEVCEDNFLHKYYLVLAEKNRLKQNVREAMSLYEKAAKLVEESFFTLDMAVIYELTARFYSETGFYSNAQTHMVRAYRAYLKFGAMVKANLLYEEFPDMVHGTYIYTAAGEQNKSVDYAAADGEDITQTQEIEHEISRGMDFLSLSKAMDSYAKNTDVESTVADLVNVIIENSGAQKACLIILEDQASGMLICGQKGQEALVYEQVKINNEESRWFSRMAVSYVVNSGELLVINDGVRDVVFNKDSYIQKNNVRSVLCLPVLIQHKLSGVLYIENNLAPYGFSHNLAEILEKLVVQVINAVRTYRMLQRENGKSAQMSQLIELLTEKEAKILRYMGQGLSNMEIAKKLYISEGTVKWHTNHIYKKLRVKNRAQAVLKAKEIEMVQENEQ